MKMLVMALLALPAAVAAKTPDCASWPTNMALVHLKNAGIVEPATIDESQTQAKRLASEKIGADLFQQVYDITFHAKDGGTIEVVTSSRASSQECSMGAVDVYVVSRHLGGE